MERTELSPGRSARRHRPIRDAGDSCHNQPVKRVEFITPEQCAARLLLDYPAFDRLATAAGIDISGRHPKLVFTEVARRIAAYQKR